MSSESVCQVARSWVDVGSFHTRLFIIFMICTASVRNILDISSYVLFGNATLTRHSVRHLLLQSENIITNAHPNVWKTGSAFSSAPLSTGNSSKTYRGYVKTADNTERYI
jgi:hypothetical protein